MQVPFYPCKVSSQVLGVMYECIYVHVCSTCMHIYRMSSLCLTLSQVLCVHVYMNILSVNFLQDVLPNLKTVCIYWSVSIWCMFEILICFKQYLNHIHVYMHGFFLTLLVGYIRSSTIDFVIPVKKKWHFNNRILHLVWRWNYKKQAILFTIYCDTWPIHLRDHFIIEIIYCL